MQEFGGRIAVITGGATGIGRSLARQLAAQGCHIAMCDIAEDALSASRAYCEATAAEGVRITSFVADVSERAAVDAFLGDTLQRHQTDHVHLLFNNAGIGGGGSFLKSPVAHWERTFNVCWQGVYGMCRAFMPSLLAADAGHVINISSVNGFWASLGSGTPHNAYCSAKFAVKGFTESLREDFAANAPHLSASVVMPGHIGTMISINTWQEFGDDPAALGMSQAELDGFKSRAETFRQTGMDPEDAAAVILKGVQAGDWRILIGDDAVALDQAVRDDPLDAYQPDFWRRRVHPRILALKSGRTVK